MPNLKKFGSVNRDFFDKRRRCLRADSLTFAAVYLSNTMSGAYDTCPGHSESSQRRAGEIEIIGRHLALSN